MYGGFVADIAVVLGVAAITSTIVKRLKLPSILGYLFAGFLIGPYIPLPLFADLKRVEGLSEFGVILVMFAVGLEFRLKKLFQVLPNAGFSAFIEMSTLFLVGTVVASFLGWTKTQGLFLGSALAISSTMLVSKVFEDQKPDAHVKRQVLGILVIQDIAAILILALLGTLAVAGMSSAQGQGLYEILTQLTGFLIGISILGLFFVPKFIRQVNRLRSRETMTVVAMGVCFGLAFLIERLGYSVALGAFLAGILISESGLSHKIKNLITPIKDMFVAVFFVSIGMQVNPQEALQFYDVIFLLSLLIIVFQFLSVSISGVLSGNGLKNSVNAGLVLGQIGEFAFIIAAIGAHAGLVENSFKTILVSVAIVTSFTTPLIWRYRQSILEGINHILPKKVDILISLYETWFSRLKQNLILDFNQSKKIFWAVAIDLVLLIVLPPLLFAILPKTILTLKGLEFSITAIQIFIALGFAVLFIPIIFSLILNIGKLMSIFMDGIFKFKNESSLLYLQNSMHLFRLSFQILILYVIWIPLIISVRVFLSSNVIYYIVYLMGAILTIYLIYKSDKDEKVLSGGERILDALARQSFPDDAENFDSIGLGDLKIIRVLNPEIFNKTLAEINLRAKTGCSVILIQRKRSRIVFPEPSQVLMKNDRLKLSGDEDSVHKAHLILTSSLAKVNH